MLSRCQSLQDNEQMVRSVDPRCEILRITHWPFVGRSCVRNSRRGNHLGQRSCVNAPAGRTCERKRSDQAFARNLLQGGGRPNMGNRKPRRMDTLLRQMIEPSRGPPAPVGNSPGASPAVNLLVAQQKALQMLPRLPLSCAFPKTRIAVIRARISSRIASCAASGTQIGVSSQARCNLASVIASRRSVLTRSPAFNGISEGATTVQPWPLFGSRPQASLKAGSLRRRSRSSTSS
jgi:hypothetical protein